MGLSRGSRGRTPPRRWDPIAWPAIVAGIVWLFGPAGFWQALIGLIPGCLLVASGVSLLLWPGDARIYRCMALSALAGVVLALPTLLMGGWVYGLTVALLSVGSFLGAGTSALPAVTANPPDQTRRWFRWRLAAKAAADEALAGYFICFARIPSGHRARETVERVRELVPEHVDWGIAGNSSYNGGPEAFGNLKSVLTRRMGRALEVISFDSGYRCPTAGAHYYPEWIQARSNARCRLRVFRQNRPGRPWLIGIHGYRMGSDWLDLQLFPPRELTDALGLNLVLPTLPLHGSRKCGLRSGDRFLDGGLLGLCYAEAQSLWDLRRTVAWIRQQEVDARIGVLGYSLGGYNAALMASHEDGLDFVIAGIPVVDLAAIVWLSLPAPHRRYFEAEGLSREYYEALLRPLSPLSHPPKRPSVRLAIFAGTVDRVVPSSQPIRLARHWGVPVRWYAGGHLGFRKEPVVNATIRETMAAAGWDITAHNDRQ